MFAEFPPANEQASRAGGGYRDFVERKSTLVCRGMFAQEVLQYWGRDDRIYGRQHLSRE